MNAHLPLVSSHFGAAYLIVLVAILILDGIWLGTTGKRLYKAEMGALMRDKPQILPVVVFYLMYPAAVAILCVGPSAEPIEAALRGGVLGLAAYGAYDMTNLAVVRGWPTRLSFIDWVWGTLLTAASAGVGTYGVLRLS